MRILVVTHYFPPEVGAPQARLSELSRSWANAGDEVTVLTGMPNHPTGVVPPEYQRRVRAHEQIDGYRVVRTWLYATRNEGMAKKTLGHLSFMVTSVLLGWSRVGRPDVVLVSSPTFFSIFSAWILAKGKRARLVVEIRDLWPAIFVELGVLSNRMVIRLLERLELAAYRAADTVVVVTEGFREHIAARGIDPKKIHTIRNGVDTERFQPGQQNNEGRAAARARLGAVADETLVLYIGAHGISQALTSVADAAAKLIGLPIHFAFVGEGAAKRVLEEHVGALRLDNVTMLASVPRGDVAALVDAADICLVPLRDIPLFETFIPSKLFEFISAGKAVVGSVRGESAQILAEAGAIVVPPEDAGALAAAIAHLADRPMERSAMGRLGRAYAERHADRRQLASRYQRILLDTDAGGHG